MLSKECFICRDHWLAFAQCLGDEVASGLNSAHEFHHNIDIGVIDHVERVCSERFRVERHATST